MIAAFGAWMALTGRFQAMIAAIKSGGTGPPSAPTASSGLTPDPGAAAPAASAGGSWTPSSSAPAALPPPSRVIAIGSSNVTLPIPDALPGVDFGSLIAAAGNDGVKATPYVPPATPASSA